jgi:hypothetical protein
MLDFEISFRQRAPAVLPFCLLSFRPSARPERKFRRHDFFVLPQNVGARFLADGGPSQMPLKLRRRAFLPRPALGARFHSGSPRF